MHVTLHTFKALIMRDATQMIRADADADRGCSPANILAFSQITTKIESPDPEMAVEMISRTPVFNPEAGAETVPVQKPLPNAAPGGKDSGCDLGAHECAIRAEKVYEELNGLGRRGVDLAIEAGDLLLRAKNQLRGKFGSTLKEWQSEGVITFSPRSARRWMLIAKHGPAIKMAKLANLQKAEKHALELEGSPRTKKKAPDLSVSPNVTSENLLASLRPITQQILALQGMSLDAMNAQFREQLWEEMEATIAACKKVQEKTGVSRPVQAANVKELETGTKRKRRGFVK